mgnify:CR=1 FL=1
MEVDGGRCIFAKETDHLPRLSAKAAGEDGVANLRVDRPGFYSVRIKAEGANATADLLLTVDAGNLWQAEQMGILQPFTSPVIDANIRKLGFKLQDVKLIVNSRL